MSDPAPDVDPDDADASDRYASLETVDQLVIYDRENHRAWLQSDAAVDTAMMA